MQGLNVSYLNHIQKLKISGPLMAFQYQEEIINDSAFITCTGTFVRQFNVFTEQTKEKNRKKAMK